MNTLARAGVEARASKRAVGTHGKIVPETFVQERTLRPVPDNCEFRPSRIEPISRIDTNDMKGGPPMTRKMAQWFESVGRPCAKSTRVEGREWIEAVECATKRRDVCDEFDSLKAAAPAREDCLEGDLSLEAVIDARHSRRVAAARGLEEKRWLARHKPKTGCSSLSSGSWQGPTCRHEVDHQHVPEWKGRDNQSDLTAGMRLRLQALWLPVSESKVARNYRPCHTARGAVLYKGDPYAKLAATGSVSDDESDAANATGVESATSVQYLGASAPAGAEKALSLWTRFEQAPLKSRPRRRGGRTRAKSIKKRMTQFESNVKNLLVSTRGW